MKTPRHADGSICERAMTTRDCPQSHRWVSRWTSDRLTRQLAADAVEYDRLVGTMADVEAAILAAAR